jgi:riboflavin kinase/FMN adenylyltransferase
MLVQSWDEFLKGKVEAAVGMACTVGVFDGVHRGHRKLIEAVVGSPYESCVFTFSNHPRCFLQGEEFALLMPIQERLAIFESLTIKRTILIDFSETFSRLKGEVFLKLLRDHGNVKFMAVGMSFKCGYNNGTDAAEIKRLNEAAGVETLIVEPALEGGLPVSSSRIRQALAVGDRELAERMLGK